MQQYKIRSSQRTAAQVHQRNQHEPRAGPRLRPEEDVERGGRRLLGPQDAPVRPALQRPGADGGEQACGLHQRPGIRGEAARRALADRADAEEKFGHLVGR